MSGTNEALKFDRSTAAGRRAEMDYLDSLSDEQLASSDAGHRFVTRNPEETPEQRALLLERLAQGEQDRSEFDDAQH